MAQYDVVVKAVDQTKTAFRSVETGLKSIEDRTKQVNQTLTRLGVGLEQVGRIAAAALGTAATSALRFADAVQDTSDATTVSTAKILAFSQAVAQNGGDATKAIDGLLKFSQTIGEAANGSKAARDSFDKIGISLQELGTLSEEALLDRVVSSLGNITDASTRAALQADFFGKTLKGTNIAGFSGDLDQLTTAQRANAEAIKSGAQLVDTLKGAYNRLELAVLKAIKPIADFVNKASPEQIDRFVNAIVELGVAIVGLTAGIKVFQGLVAVLGTLGGAVALVSGGFAALAARALTVGNLFKNLGLLLTVPLVNGASILARFTLGWVVLKGTLLALAAPIGAIVLGVVQIGAVAAAAAYAIDSIFDTKIIDTFVNGVKSAYNAVKEFVGLGGKKVELPGISQAESDNEIKRMQNRAAAAAAATAKATGGGRPVANKELESFYESIKLARQEYALFLPLLSSKDPAVAAAALEKVSSAAKILQKTLSDDVVLANFNTQLKEQADALRAQQVIYKDSARTIAENNIALGQQDVALNKTAQLLADAATQQKVFEQSVRGSRQGLEQQVVTLGLAEKALASNKITSAEYIKILQGIDEALLSASQRQELFNEAISTGMSKAAATAEMAGQAMNEAFAGGDIERFTNLYEQYADVVGRSATGELAVANRAAKKEVETTNMRALALKNLTEEYKKNGNAGDVNFRKVAESLGMSTSAIDRMVSVHGDAFQRMAADTEYYKQSITNATDTFTSEFTKAFLEGRNVLDSFRNFFSNIANDIATRIIKQQLTDPIADALSGIAGKLIGSIGGSGGGGGGGFFSSIISSAGSFLGDIFGGFFADGGTLGAGQIGIVGEAGPEMITGPANITPMDQIKGGDGNLQVVFQIQAIDTQTGAQFLLQNKPLITSMITQAYNSRGRRGPLD